MGADPYIGQEIIGQFRIVERIGKGGMGAVYKAEQPAMGRFVAIKILHRNLAARKDLVSRFRREARAMSRLTHPNTARVFIYDQLEDGALYLVMEYLEGRNLAQVTRHQGPMPLERAARVMVQCCDALEEAHSVGIVHRDLKPENIILTEQGGISDFPKVLDFGLAKVRDTDLRSSGVLTQQGMVFGTPEFMSPEQAQGVELDGRSDIYSLGVILYELVTGKLPFDARSPTEYIRHHIKSEPIPPTQRRPELRLPQQLDAVMARALAKDAKQRFQTAGEFASALRTFLPDRDTGLEMRSSHPAPRPSHTPIATPQVQAGGGVAMSNVPAPEAGRSRAPVILIGVLVAVIVILAATLVGVLVATRGG